MEQLNLSKDLEYIEKVTRRESKACFDQYCQASFGDSIGDYASSVKDKSGAIGKKNKEAKM